MGIIVYLIGELVTVSFLGTSIQVLIGICVYFGILLILKDKNILFIFNNIKKINKSNKTTWESEI